MCHVPGVCRVSFGKDGICDTPSMKCTNIAIAMLSTTSCSDSDGKQYSLCFCSTECLYTYSMMLANYTEYCAMHDLE